MQFSSAIDSMSITLFPQRAGDERIDVDSRTTDVRNYRHLHPLRRNAHSRSVKGDDDEMIVVLAVVVVFVVLSGIRGDAILLQ